MVSLTSVLAAGALLLPSISALPTTSSLSVRDPSVDATAAKKPFSCGIEPTAGIYHPVSNATITISKTAQNNYDPVTFEIIYCSSQYFKTSSLNVSTWLSGYAGSTVAPSYGAQALSLGNVPDSSVAPAGYYGYRYNVSVYPDDGNYPSGQRVLSVYEVETGYYDANNIEIHSININFKLA